MPSKRPRLMIDVSPELRRRIKIAAADQDRSAREFVVGILEDAVPHGAEGLRGRPVTKEMINRLERARRRVGRRFTADSTDLGRPRSPQHRGCSPPWSLPPRHCKRLFSGDGGALPGAIGLAERPLTEPRRTASQAIAG